MSLGFVALIGLVAAALQVAGYTIYIRNFLMKAIRPNAASFLMFSYGTSFLAFLEWRGGATWQVLALPVICSVIGIVVALLCFRKGATEAIDRFEGFSFAADLWLTVAYGWLALAGGGAGKYVVPFLIATNLTAITCFLPIIRSTWRMPERELATPWFVWTAAYACLGVATWFADGGRHPALLLYPLLNSVLHIVVGLLALRRYRRGVFAQGLPANTYIAKSAINGLGLFASKPFAAGQTICSLSGDLKRNPASTRPNWIGIGPKTWVDPKRPLDHVNHSCAANAAFSSRRRLVALRAIGAAEEITLDYSTTEVDPDWTMACDCRALGCRLGLHAIHISFADHVEAPPASPLMQLIWRKRRNVADNVSAFPQLVPVSRRRRRDAAPSRKRLSSPLPSERVN